MAAKLRIASVHVDRTCFEYTEGVGGEIIRVDLGDQSDALRFRDYIRALVKLRAIDVVAFSTVFEVGGFEGPKAQMYHMMSEGQIEGARVAALLNAIGLVAWHQHTNPIASPPNQVGVLTFVDGPDGGGKCQCLVVNGDLSNISKKDSPTVVGTGTLPITWHPIEAVQAIQGDLERLSPEFDELLVWSRNPLAFHDLEFMAALAACGIKRAVVLPPEAPLWGTSLVVAARLE